MRPRLIGILAAMLALAAAALSTGSRVYYCLLFALALTILYSAASVLWTLFSAKADMKGVKKRVARGDRLSVILSLKHSCVLPVGALTLELNVPSALSGSQQIRMTAAPFKNNTYRTVIRCPHRGDFDVGVRSLMAEDLFGIFRLRRKSGERLLQVEVVPKALPMTGMQLRAQDTGPEFHSAATEDNASPSDIRKWQNGDELKKVHWKLSLRKRELMVRTFEDSARPDTLIIPDLSDITALRDQKLTLEDGICEAALGAVKAQLETGYPIRMPLHGARPQEIAAKTSSALSGAAEALTHVKFDSPYSYEQVLMLMMQRLQRTGGAVFITAHMSGRIADIALRMVKSGLSVRLFYICDAPKDEILTMLERLRLAGVEIGRTDPSDTAQGVSADGDIPGEEFLFEV